MLHANHASHQTSVCDPAKTLDIIPALYVDCTHPPLVHGTTHIALARSPDSNSVLACQRLAKQYEL